MDLELDRSHDQHRSDSRKTVLWVIERGGNKKTTRPTNEGKILSVLERHIKHAVEQLAPATGVVVLRILP